MKLTAFSIVLTGFLTRLATAATPHHRETFFAGGHYVPDDDGAHILSGQMYVEHLTPFSDNSSTGTGLKPPPLVFIHGRTRTGSDWLTKPDGQPGWADFYLRHGYECYLLDQPSIARSPWGPPTNLTLEHFSAERAERIFTAPEKFNLFPQAKHHTQWPGTGRMGDPIFDQLVATSTYLVADVVFQQATAKDAMVALLDRIAEPVILFGHSQGGIVPWFTADARPDLVAAIVGLEPGAPPFRNEFPFIVGPARPYGLTDIPIAYDPPVQDAETDFDKVVILSNSSDLTNCTLQAEPARKAVNLLGIPTILVTAQGSPHAMFDWCTVAYLRQVGVDVEHWDLGAMGIEGNGHMLFMETNSDAIAAEILRWISNMNL